ncbi:unnamed protein product [Parajaminaea phylloscopi]
MSPSIPKEHKAAVCEEGGKGLVIKTVPTPQPGEEQVLIKVSASSICYSDHMPVDGLYPGVTYPMTPGHEVIGRIVAKGSRVSDEYKEGALVGLGWNGGYCQQCQPCRQGHFHACEKHVVTGVTTNGGHQEYVTAHWSAVVSVPEEDGKDGLSHAEMAPLLCAGLTVNDALNYGNVKPGETVIVQGIGGLGHLAIQFAAKSGYHVVAISGGDSKRDLALKLGAHDFYAAKDAEQGMKKYGGAKLAVATAPSADAISSLLPLLARNGQLVMVGLPTDGKPIQADPFQLLPQRRSIHGLTCGSPADNEALVRFAALGNTKVKPIIKTWPLDKANEAYQHTVKESPLGRNVIVFD